MCCFAFVFVYVCLCEAVLQLFVVTLLNHIFSASARLMSIYVLHFL